MFMFGINNIRRQCATNITMERDKHNEHPSRKPLILSAPSATKVTWLTIRFTGS
jgi:hypothetical protein